MTTNTSTMYMTTYRSVVPRPLISQPGLFSPNSERIDSARFVLNTVSAAETRIASANRIASSRSRSFNSTGLRYRFTSSPKMMRIDRRVPVNQFIESHTSDTPATTLVQSMTRVFSSSSSDTRPFLPSRPGTKLLIWSVMEFSSSVLSRTKMPSTPNPSHSAANTANSAW